MSSPTESSTCSNMSLCLQKELIWRARAQCPKQGTQEFTRCETSYNSDMLQSCSIHWSMTQYDYFNWNSSVPKQSRCRWIRRLMIWMQDCSTSPNRDKSCAQPVSISFVAGAETKWALRRQGTVWQYCHLNAKLHCVESRWITILNCMLACVKHCKTQRFHAKDGRVALHECTCAKHPRDKIIIHPTTPVTWRIHMKTQGVLAMLMEAATKPQR